MGIVQSTFTNLANNFNQMSTKIDIVVENPEEETIIDIKQTPSSYEDWVFMDIGYGIDSRREVHDMYMTVQRLGLTDWIKHYKSSKRYSKEVSMISNGLDDNNHSGASFGGCLWRTKEVYVNGFYPKYCRKTQKNV